MTNRPHIETGDAFISTDVEPAPQVIIKKPSDEPNPCPVCNGDIDPIDPNHTHAPKGE